MPWAVEPATRDSWQVTREKISLLNYRRVKRMRGRTRNVTPEVPGNQRDTYPRGVGAMGQTTEKPSVSRGDFGKISGENKCSDAPADQRGRETASEERD